MADKINNSCEHQRRPLSFPAVRPCVSTSPSTLLASLITLAQNICNFHSNSFVFHRRNVRETTRQIAILLVLFQELHDRGSIIPHSIRLCFSDLHVTFQKIHFLMQDCSRESARLWMLTKSQFIATQFRVLVREVAIVLDAIPVCCIDINNEIKELVELVTKQANRGNLQLDRNDENEAKRLRFLLAQLERGIEPDVDVVKSVLNYLEIKSWTSCNKEIKFLEDELDFNEEEVSLLNSLIGFLCYSRVVIFETIDYQSSGMKQIEAKCSMEMLSCVVPEDFRCPISLEIMTDPVTISSGQTYNRASIQKWFNSGNLICPKTREKLASTELVPNTALKKLIQKFCSENGVIVVNPIDHNQTVTKTSDAGSPAAAHAMQFLSWFLSRRLVFGTEEQKTKAAYEIRLLAKSSVFNRACLVEMGTVPPLLDLLAADDRNLQESAISALMKLSKHTSGQKLIIESRGLAPILKVLKRGLSLEARHVAAAVIFYLSSSKEYRKLIGENPDVIPALVEMVKEETTFGKNNSVVAIFGLLLRRKNHAIVLSAGAVPVLVNTLASSGNANLVTDSLAVLVALAESVEGAYALLRAEALPLVAKILQSATSRSGKEYCASILLALCVNVGAEVTGVLAKEASVMPSLYSLLTDGTPHAAKKARALINVILEFSDKRFSGTVGSSVSRQRLVNLN
ncbi:hypothetical protein AAZX31_06G175500 [Glycine max]|uniref:RING-type E3 ubiquitin transferase n=2 Tax=Glycine subgen. Soja TaxID=1462606 RepID=I1KCH7_SOYBN|nr:U-box domain-containing protein 18 [Glycine max]XP_028237132.1 U-box domain-containing protein 18-like [Glycine soja]KAG5032052.1 hypothetical protein JHK85_016034 [Glycine max]KAG5046264.1 hypothetical protein JHK86_015670 [Glycine max]KAG5148763.1 hypothetical protein JHK82_015644 [Glycine max]KAH1246252.1 U-box domain-containing protein 18 [Glycine max]KRH54418.1 hypothetical protein GLYMA_06G183800v4 [Glycine max]|eukprot:XP_003527025.1 U-box domain-containing protein 18 [Glycine max]